MLAAVLVIVAAAIYYVTTAGPSAVVTGSATLDENNDVIFTPSSSMTPTKISAGEWDWAVYRGASKIGSNTADTTNDLERGVPVKLDLANDDGQSGDEVKIKYKGTWYDAATIGE